MSRATVISIVCPAGLRGPLAPPALPGCPVPGPVPSPRAGELGGRV